MKRIVFAGLLFATPAFAGDVTLQLNSLGVAGLEQMLDIARRNAATMRDADMAVSLWNALQRAKDAAAQADAQKAASDAQALQGKDAEIAKLRSDLEAAKKAPATEGQ